MKARVSLAVLATLLVTATAQTTVTAQECAKEFAALDSQIQGARLQAAYKGREAEHPLVLKLKGGELVDLTGVIVTATPYESWTGDSPVVDKIGGYMVEAKPLIEADDEEKCQALLDQARSEIKGYQQPSDSTDN